MNQPIEFEDMKNFCKDLGADIFGICNLDSLEEYETIPENLLEDYTHGIVIGINLGNEVFEGLPETRSLYSQIYEIANRKLDSMCLDICRLIRKKGYNALQIPASKVLENTFQRSYMSHKAVAREAGLGWIGKSMLFISKDHGPRVRLASVLTDMSFDIDVEVMESKCGDCTKCIDLCVVGALEDSEFTDFPIDREGFQVEKCAEKLKEFERDPDIGNSVCGICIKACPVGRDGKKID